MSIIDVDRDSDDDTDLATEPASGLERVRVVVELAVIVLIAVIAIVIWPAPLGGDTSFMIVHGTSMQPSLDSGDVVVTRSAGHYVVGDIIASRVPAGQAGSGHVIIHRIVAITPRGFEMRGDNRASHDAWYPSAHDVIGRMVLRIPVPAGEGFWRALPWLFGALIGIGIVWLLWTRPSDDEGSDLDAAADLTGQLDAPESEPVEDLVAWMPPATERIQMDLPRLSPDDLDDALRLVLESLSSR
jgi:signal peptidase